jgi:hypothetical protein
VAVLGLALVTIWYETEVHQQQSAAGLLAAALPFAVVAGAHTGSLGRWLIPCRTVAWALLWAIPVLFLAGLIPGLSPLVGVALAWALAVMVLGWRLAKSMLVGREFGREQSRSAALAAPHAGTLPRPDGLKEQLTADPDAAASRQALAAAVADVVRRQATGRPGRLRAARGVRGGDPRPRAGPHRRRRPAAATGHHRRRGHGRARAMIGLSAVKDQVRSIAASIEAARRRALAGYGAEKPMQHFVFLGPPGTGKTAVARIIAKIFYAFGLLETPAVVEAHRADLVGEYLGATAIKTNELVDSALGGVLFIDEAYSLVNEGDGQGDRFGNEAVQTLLKRAEDDRDDLIIILAGTEADGLVPVQQPWPDLPLRDGVSFPATPCGAAPAGRRRDGLPRELLDPTPAPCSGACSRTSAAAASPTARQRPVRPQPAGKGHQAGTSG